MGPAAALATCLTPKLAHFAWGPLTRYRLLGSGVLGQSLGTLLNSWSYLSTHPATTSR